MKTTNFQLVKYEADENKVFDWADLSAHVIKDEEGNEIQEHLYAKTLYIGGNDSIENYVEIDAPVKEA